MSEKPEIKYTHNELIEAVERIKDKFDYGTQVEASRKAGEILNKSLDAMEKQVVSGLTVEEEKDPEDVPESSFSNEALSL